MYIMQADDVTASVLVHIFCKRNNLKCGVFVLCVCIYIYSSCTNKMHTSILKLICLHSGSHYHFISMDLFNTLAI